MSGRACDSLAILAGTVRARTLWPQAFWVGVLGFVMSADVCGDDIAKQAPTEVESQSTEVSRDQILRWVDRFRDDQVLFRDQDLAQLRQELGEASPEGLQHWWVQTAGLRAIVPRL